MELHILSEQEKLIQGQGSIIEGQVNIVQGQETIIQGQENLHTTLTENTAELLGINKQQLVSLQVMNISLEQIVKKQRCASSICHFYFDSGPFILQPLFKKGVENWFEKSGSRNLVREKWLTRKKGGFIP